MASQRRQSIFAHFMMNNDNVVKQKVEANKRKARNRQTIVLHELQNVKTIQQNVIGNYLKSLEPHVQKNKLFKDEFHQVGD